MPSLQWQKSLDSGATWTDIAGANAATFTANNTTAGIYQYRMLVADGSNITVSSCRVSSNLATIKIHKMPAAIATNNGPVCENSVVNLTALSGATYDWTGP